MTYLTLTARLEPATSRSRERDTQNRKEGILCMQLYVIDGRFKKPDFIVLLSFETFSHRTIWTKNIIYKLFERSDKKFTPINQISLLEFPEQIDNFFSLELVIHFIVNLYKANTLQQSFSVLVQNLWPTPPSTFKDVRNQIKVAFS